MTTYEPAMVETDGGLLCRDCAAWCYFGTRMLAGCDVEDCTCEPCAAARRAVEMDDRPSDKLAAIAAELEAENRPDAAELVAERFGRPPRSRA